ncbi:DNA polymerase III subunit gamma/tau [bacterium]|nr:DNA polymerase III subunit gamma/tau [bacterium]
MLYQKYRPQFFSELVGQDHIKEILLEALKQKKVAHAYLFSGPRGTGKTTTARLLAKALNCLKPRSSGEPCGRCANCLAFQEGRFMDLVEIDAASHTGVDNIRDLKNRILLAPSAGQYKVYIIDEVHMLSKGAFNALLKTLEEPPKNVVFILATTEPFAVIQTIISRCQRFDFQPLSVQDIYKTLRRVATKEKIKISPEALKIITVYAQGSLRDGFSFLDQVSSLRGEITEKRAKKALGIIDVGALVRIFDALSLKDRRVISEIQKEAKQGFSSSHLINAMLRYLEDLIFLRTTKNSISPLTKEMQTKILRQAESFDLLSLSRLYQLLLQARFQSKDIEVETLPLEMALLGFLEDSSLSEVQPKVSKKKEKIKSKQLKKIKKKEVSDSNSKSEDIKDFEAKWEKVVTGMKKYNHSLSAFLAKSEAKYNKGKIFLRVPFKLYYETLKKPKNLDYLHKIIHKVFHSELKVELYLMQNRPTQEIKKIFGI